MLRKGYPVTNVYLFKNKLWIKEFSTRMHEWLEGNKRPPIKIDAEMHRRCNLNCKFCSRRESDINMTEESKEIEVPEKRWLETVEQSGKMGVDLWNISGIGEPMCKPNLTMKVMERLKDFNIFGEITTNGTLWDEEYVKNTVKMGWDSVCVSLDSPKKNTHNNLRGGKAFDRALRTLNLFSKWKKKLDSKKPTVTINAILNKKNYDQMPELFLLGRDLDVNSIFVEPMIVYTERGEKLKLGREEILEFQDIAKKCKDIAKKYGIEPNINTYTEDREFDENLVDKTSEMKEVIEEDSEENYENFKDPDKEYSHTTEDILNIPCYYPWFYMIITADGSVSHCGEKINKVNNIKDKDLKEIWFGEEMEKIRQKFKDKELPSYCNRCRPNVVGDTRRIRKSIIELRDKEYLLNAITNVEYMNQHIKEKIKLLKNSNDLDLGKCGENCKHKKRLRELKESKIYKISSKISQSSFGKLLKKRYHEKKNSQIYENIEKEKKSIDELKDLLMSALKRNKLLKDSLYNLKAEKDIHKNLENICKYERELLELKNSLTYRFID